MRLKNVDLIITVSIVTMNVIYVLLPIHFTVIGIILTMPLVFLLPGYTLVEALSYKRSLDTTYRFILSLGLSLVIDILSGFILNMFPIGLRAISWVVFLGLLTAIFSLLVTYLRRRSLIREVRLPRFRFRIHEYILFGLATIVAILSIQYSAISVLHQPHPGFTQLWILSSPQTDNNCAVRLGVRSFESSSATYRITMTVNNDQVNIRPSIVLIPQEEWDQLVPITPKSTTNVYVEIRLYKMDKPETVYREVHLTLYGMDGNKGRKMIC